MSTEKFGILLAILALTGSCSAPGAQANKYRHIEAEIRAAASSTPTRKAASHAVAKTTNDYQTGNIDRTNTK